MKKIITLISFVVLAFSMDYKEIREIYYKSYNYEKMDDYKDAIKVLIPLYQKYPNGYTLNLRLAWLFYLNKNYQNAIKHYEIAQKLAPYSFEPKLGLMRVYNTIGKSGILKLNDFVINLNTQEIYKNRIPLKITQAEKELLFFLLKNKNRFVSKEEIIDSCGHWLNKERKLLLLVKRV